MYVQVIIESYNPTQKTTADDSGPAHLRILNSFRSLEGDATSERSGYAI